jgi:hypothetical protein
MDPLEKDPEAGVAALLVWLELATIIAPDNLQPDLNDIRDWYVAASETVPAEELFFNEIDYTTREIAASNSRIGEWSNANCNI